MFTQETGHKQHVYQLEWLLVANPELQLLDKKLRQSHFKFELAYKGCVALYPDQIWGFGSKECYLCDVERGTGAVITI